VAHVAVVGGGVVGVTASLLAARRGWRVTLFEAEDRLWTRASAANEGKVHLGPVFALGDEATVEVMQEGALSFADVLEEACGSSLPWSDLVTDAFDYVVMPDSLSTPDELSRRYRVMNERVAEQSGTYLGEALSHVADPTVRRDERTGLPAFRTTERAVEPLLLGRQLCDAALSDPSITVHTGCRVSRVRRHDARGGGAVVTWRGPCGEVLEEHFDAVVNAAWDGQQALLPPADQVSRNFRLKAAVRLPRRLAEGHDDHYPTVTLVQGPYGDVVAHRDYVYASWYPVGRLSNEHGTTPSPEADQVLASLTGRADLVEGQLQPLRELGLLPAVADGSSASLVGGFIAGHGKLDIDVRASQLHRRAEFGPQRVGGMVLATNFKLTTAPLAAKLAIDEVARELTGGLAA
jgi:glycine/D-amino acid oxidase-like deaminating enzyme